MSKFSKRKHLVGQVLGQEIETLTEKQSIVKVVKPKGNNLHEVESATGETYLMSMPTKFRNVAYVKGGDFVLVEAIDEGDKVKAEMVNIIVHDHITDYIRRGIWPQRFMDAVKREQDNVICDDRLLRNVNRPPVDESDESDDDSDDASD